MKFHYATVIDNNDPKLLGRVKIKIESKMDGFTDDMCPWASAFLFSIGGMTATDVAAPYGSLKVPRIGSLVWVFFADEENEKHPKYMADVTLDAMRLSQTIFLEAAKIIMNAWIVSPSGIDGTYPNLHYTMYPSGMIIGTGIDSKKEFFIYHSPTTFVSIDDSGKVNVAGSEIVLGSTNITVSSLLGNKIEVSESEITASNVAGTGSVSIDTAGNITVKGLTVQIDGTTNIVTPTGSGGLCGLPNCLFTGAPQTGNKIL